MFVLIIILVVVGFILFKWLKPYLEYKRIGSYDEYKAVSKSLNDKKLEYSWYQINGFKNIDTEAIEYLRQVSKCCTKNDLKWLNQCREFLEEGLIKAEEGDATKLFLHDPVENTNLFNALKVIKRCRKPLPAHYQKIGCATCGEAAVLHVLFETRISLIESGENLKPGDMDYFIDAVYEVKKGSASDTKNTTSPQTQPVKKNVNQTATVKTQTTNTAMDKITDAEKEKLASMGKLDVVTTAYNKAINGDSQAMMFMGMTYNLDLESPKKAFYWMDKATQKGNAQAEYFLGTYYADGYGVEKNRTKGISIILSSASKGNKDAIDCCINKMEMSIEEMRNCGIPV